MIRHGLQDTPSDERDYSLGGVFSYISPSKIPDSFRLPSVPIWDQQDTDECAGYASARVNSIQEKVELSPDYQFRAIKLTTGKPGAYGANLRDACKALTDIGSVESKDFPYRLKDNSRDFFAYPENISPQYETLAKRHRKKSYFSVDGPYDLYTNIKTALWTHREENSAVLTGIKWRPQWIDVPDGKIQGLSDFYIGHAIAITGYTPTHLIAELSSGDKVGDKGVFYLPPEIVNSECVYGAYLFKDISPAYAGFLHNNGLKYSDELWKKIAVVLKKIFGVV